MSQINHYPEKISGLTLIEVLVALAIISVAMTAVIKASSQNIRSTAYLQNKTIAMWVGQQVLNEARAGVLKLPNPPDSVKETTAMLGHDWYWEANQEETPNKRINQIRVKVFAQEGDEASPLITLETFKYHAE
jgi:general secretion pathway protein I